MILGANTAAAANFTVSPEIFGEKDTAGARWIARDFTKYAPAETIIEPWCLKADRVKNTRSAATPTRFFLGQRHHASTDVAARRVSGRYTRSMNISPSEVLPVIPPTTFPLSGSVTRTCSGTRSANPTVASLKAFKPSPMTLSASGSGALDTRRMGFIRLLRST